MPESKRIQAVVLDAGPLITQTASNLQQYADEFYTTPGVHGELKDEHSRQQLLLWGNKLKIRHPKAEFIQKVISFSKLTGDYQVLSVNDLHIIALSYELECELNDGDWRLRKFLGQKLEFLKSKNGEESKDKDVAQDGGSGDSGSQQVDTVVVESAPTKKPRRRGGKRQREKREAELKRLLEEQGNHNQEEAEAIEEVKEEVKEDVDNKPIEEQPEEEVLVPVKEDENAVSLEEEYDEDDDDGDWITPENLQEEMLKDTNEEIQESNKTGPFIKIALATGDFACQNVAMQIGLNLLNAMSGKQIKRVRNYMYRCHACFRLTPMSKEGKPKHFCPKCGGNTLLRCAVSVDNVTGRITPHLKANFQWHKRGQKFTLPSPLSKNQQRLQGNAGYQHNKQSRHKSLQDPLILREDQKEYQQAVKDDDWQRRQNEKILQEWIGGGSADNFISPFSSVNTIRHSGVKVGRGRYVNSSKGKRK
ncbi:nob1 [[Candida] subhashii]|uniref:20S-pre-rRNA D-site endonuclease NOB1 n=1 Tax=[Candida] subhashii TaxID=561895 RepID=A0A8J5QKF8_9ASCO|nr:nob1 [[Candida] subhashii]KAG7664722.1 nob1 [[Candida] subhashii]